MNTTSSLYINRTHKKKKKKTFTNFYEGFASVWLYKIMYFFVYCVSIFTNNFFLFLRILKDIPSQPLLIDIMFMLKYSRTNRIVISIVFLNLLELFI